MLQESHSCSKLVFGEVECKKKAVDYVNEREGECSQKACCCRQLHMSKVLNQGSRSWKK